LAWDAFRQVSWLTARVVEGELSAGSVPTFPPERAVVRHVVTDGRAAYSCGYSSGWIAESRSSDSLFIRVRSGTQHLRRMGKNSSYKITRYAACANRV
jgi:hypothetical protein